MATKQGEATEEGEEHKYFRPPFDAAKFNKRFEEVLSKYETKDGAKLLDLIGINSLIVLLEEPLMKVYTKLLKEDPDQIPYETALSARYTNLLQRKVNPSNPAMIKDFAILFIETVQEHAVKYGSFTNASLGEIDKELYDADVPKLILFLTAFFTKSCLLSGDPNSINHIDHTNHTIAYQSDKIIRNAIQCIIDKELTDEGFKEIMSHFVFADAHTRGGTEGKGNSFPEYYDELNKDPLMKKFCDNHQEQLKLKTPLEMDKKRIKSCNPFLLDLIVGICSFSLYAAFCHANKHHFYMNMSSDRTKKILRPNSEGKYAYGVHHSSRVNTTSIAFHPNYTEKNLTNVERTMGEMEQLDRGISKVLTPLIGVCIKVYNGDGEIEQMEFPGGETDFFRRLFSLRRYGDPEGDYDNINFKRLEEGKQKLKELKEQLKAKKAEVKKLNKELKEAKREDKRLAGEIERVEERKKLEAENESKRKEKEIAMMIDKQNKKKKKQEEEEAEERQVTKRKEEAKEFFDGFFRR